VRGGAIPLLCWATLLVLLLAINWIWTGDAIQVGTFAFAALAIYLGGLTLWLVRREALRKGPPPPRSDPEAVPEASLAAVAIGLAIGCILFGLAWAQFLIWFGGGVLVLSLGRLAVELRGQRASVRRAEGGGGP
jgi:uncharacterized iron-regulated membrane protein